MRITELLKQESIGLNVSVSTKDEAIDKLVDLMAAGGRLKDKAGYKEGILAREALGSTGIGGGIAIPHAKVEAVKEPGLAAMVVPAGVDYEAFDGSLANILFMIAAPEEGADMNLEALSRLSTLLMNPDFMEELLKAESKEAFLKVIDDAETAKFGAEERKESEEKKEAAGYRVLAVTACPTGIAHTYMAAEGLEKAARAAGCSLKVETRGSGGAKNVLTEQEIAEAGCIIVAADAKVPMDRFHGKKLIECPVSDGISKAEQLIERAMKGDAPVYQAGKPEAAKETKASGGAAHKIYTQLMNGVSHMLPFVVGGGILIALAFLIDGLSMDINSLSDEARSAFGTITPAAAALKGIGGIAFGFMLPILAGFIAMSIGDRPALAVGFVGGMIAAGGKSGFLGALLAGFIAGYLVLFLGKLFSRLPEALEKIAPVLLYPVFGILLIGLIMTFIIEHPVGFLNTSLNAALAGMSGTSKILLGIVVAGMMAVDMGGPFNKAAYVFGTASIAAGNYDIMAAVMIGGMVPPCAIALATLLFKNKFTKEERESGPVNFIMGLAFITEGAIPFAASDPLHVLPACVVGAGVSGALSMAFGCTLMAPHGGIFVFPVVGNAMMYLAALVIGTLIGAFLLGALKKKTAEK